jgi:hypothetical protein
MLDMPMRLGFLYPTARNRPTMRDSEHVQIPAKNKQLFLEATERDKRRHRRSATSFFFGDTGACIMGQSAGGDNVGCDGFSAIVFQVIGKFCQ